MSVRWRLAVVSLAALLAACGDKNAAESPEAAAPPELAVEAPAAHSPQLDVTPDPAAIAGLRFEMTAQAFTDDCMATLKSSEAEFRALEAFGGEPSVDSFYKPVNAMLLTFSDGYSKAGLFANVHPDADVRAAAEACEQEYDKLGTEISLSRPIFDAMSKIEAGGADEATRFSLTKSLRDYKRAGVDKDEATRDRIRQLNEDITKIGQDFDRNIREDVRALEVTSADELAGLPEDYIALHAPDENGIIRITTDYPDYVPFITYAKNDDLRKQLRILARDRGYPQNEAILKDLIVKRDELAHVLGYRSYAHYVTENKMVGSPERAQAFIDEIAGTVRAAAERDKKILLERLRQIDPSATEVGVWQYGYLKELLAGERYQVDSKALREYFQFGKVRQGIFDLTSDLFGIDIRPFDTPVWHEDVTAYQIWQGDKLIGLFYLDLHPRDGKYKHAAHFGVQDGIQGVQLPISVLVCNFPGQGDDAALMEHDDVLTFLHEFGHLLHAQFAGHGDWINNAGVSTEWDFVEAPSQLLEEWAYDYDTLKTFAINHAGETIPEELVKALNRARFFGQGIDTATQTFYASLSLAYYSRDPNSFELLPLMQELEAKYGPFPYLDGTHFYTNFGHLNGYSAIYYTYQWSLAIATDMFSRFKDGHMRDTGISHAYRKAILDPGGSRPADELVEDFLGRPFTTDAYKDWLTRTE